MRPSRIPRGSRGAPGHPIRLRVSPAPRPDLPRILRAAPLVLLACLAAACTSLDPGSPVPAAGAAERFHAGMTFGLFARREPAFITGGMDEVHGLAANAISIVVPWVTPDVRSMRIAPREDMSPRDDALRLAIREAHRRGMSVLLMPIVYVDEMEEGEWRGTLDPPDWKAWFAEYGRMILHYARLAAEEHVSILSVGSELCSAESRREEWLELIGAIRALYAGALTYSSNWDHREELSFGEALDYLGMNAYFELSRDPEAPVDELVRAWRPIQAEVERWRGSVGKPLLLTEVGYPSRHGAAMDPWDYTAAGLPDPEAQERAYRAFLEAWAGAPGLAGVYFYLWWGEGGPADTGYTPKGKPAEALLRGWFAEIAQREAP